MGTRTGLLERTDPSTMAAKKFFYKSEPDVAGRRRSRSRAAQVIEIPPRDVQFVLIVCPKPPQSAATWTFIPEGTTSGKTLLLAGIFKKALSAADNRLKHLDKLWWKNTVPIQVGWKAAFQIKA